MYLDTVSRRLDGVIVGTDLDGVGYSFVEALRRFARSLGLPVSDSPPKNWDFFIDEWGWTMTQFLEVFTTGIDAGVIFREGRPMYGFAAGMRALKAAGATIYIVTDRNAGTPGVAPASTIAWLDANRIPYDGITFTGKKVVPCRGFDIFIDDGPHNVAALTDAGIRCVVQSASYNRQTSAPNGRVDNFGQYVRMIQNEFGHD